MLSLRDHGKDHGLAGAARLTPIPGAESSGACFARLSDRVATLRWYDWSSSLAVVRATRLKTTGCVRERQRGGAPVVDAWLVREQSESVLSVARGNSRAVWEEPRMRSVYASTSIAPVDLKVPDWLVEALYDDGARVGEPDALTVAEVVHPS
jgi:hypothetical protein